MPRKGKEKEFDELLNNLGLVEKKRTYASTQWLLYRKGMGIYPLPALEFDSKQDFQARIGARIDAIIQSAEDELRTRLSSLQASHLADAVVDFFLLLPTIKVSLRIEIGKFNTALAESLRGATVKSINSKSAHFEYQCRSVFRLAFVDYVTAFCGTSKWKHEPGKLRALANSLHMILKDKWGEVLWRSDHVELKGCLSEPELKELLVDGSKPVIYYVAGWILFKLQSYAKKLACASREDESLAWSEFCVHNKQSLDDLDDEPQSELVDKRDYFGKVLIISAGKWYSFLEMLEGVYLANFNPTQAFQHKSDILHAIDKTIQESAEMKSLFESCIPTSFDSAKITLILDGYHLFILPWYSRMKGRDVQRIMKGYKVRPDKDTFSLRKLIITK